MEGGQYRGLPIDITGINIDTLDTTATPLNGMHYLCQVRKQADQMPSIHVSTNRDALIRKTFNNQQKSLYHVDEVKSISKNYLPTQRWIDAFIKEFTNKREVKD